MTGVISSSSVGEKINEWYMYIRRFSIPDAEYLRREIKQELDQMEEDQDLHLYYSLMEFRHNLMLEYLEPLEKMRIEEQPRLSDLLLEIDKKQARLTGLLEYYFNFFRGMYELERREYVLAIQFFKKAESKLIFVKDKIDKAEFFFKMSEVYYYMKQTYVSMDYARQAFEIYSEQTTYDIRMIQCQSLFGANFLDLKQYEKAIAHFQKAYTLAEAEQQPQLMGRTLYNIALCKQNQNSFESAIEYVKKSIQVFEGSKMLPSLPQAFFLITQIYFKLGKMDNACEYHIKGKEYSAAAGDTVYLTEFEFLESLYLSGPDEERIEKCFVFLESKMMYADIEDFALDVAKYYHQQENYKKASNYFLKVEEARQHIQGGVNLYEMEV
ncbi:tetratricopeptide repeat protein [Bacillus inaquosorum]|uniref:response regulator aspartate phosphatase n=3 Tax=Bacillus inaquosorum TaxID=483913 RepID=UPI00227F28F5|nr:tetratricopeptide repeat protein [Bacillus inaquosorum]MCY7978230.1 tetratricopeptide repeat protein [Bacillus inaquosorum]MCY8054761.1 tetratricopeptide repeat protein [Bacillus inaquosorum]MCY8751470.1 tetratricopeptide repeat protein [Bacillus inaquosorum]MCY9341074.1 tetratricopeptide repeat protein [Bacillus inaquosorum]MCY9417371.1 tetratricopeptide repeat protein [Bacillus inaquosorum]